MVGRERKGRKRRIMSRTSDDKNRSTTGVNAMYKCMKL